jgi:hypothetical protein
MRITPRRPSAPMVVSSLALFVSLGGAGYAATGGNFILGQPNSATKSSSLSASVNNPALALTNTNTGASATGLALTVDPAKPPLTVNSSTKVTNLNADFLGGLHASSFLRKQAPLKLTGSVASDGVIAGTNTGSANGVQGISSSNTASGVYGENDGTGFGLAGRANSGGTGVYAEALGGGHAVTAVANDVLSAAISATNSSGAGPELHTSPFIEPMTVDSSVKVDNLNADYVDNASIVARVVTSPTPNTVIAFIPGFGHLFVNSCDHTTESFGWTDDGSGEAHVLSLDLANQGDGLGDGTLFGQTFPAHTRAWMQLSLSRSNAVAQITITAVASTCAFTAQGVVVPG